jgi:lipid II:glycine glycyltransferase (peptidoglycan interpeptide bridge formation enzyme)
MQDLSMKLDTVQSSTLGDADWDQFVEQVPNGHHVQTSSWARLKKSVGWESLRRTLSDGHNTIGGFQMLLRRLPVLGKFGYVPKGPLAVNPTINSARMLIARIQQVAQENNIQILLVQPPDNQHLFTDVMLERGFQVSPTSPFPVATVVADLTLAQDELLARMTQKRRYNIRVAQRKGVTVREANSDDLGTFYRCLTATAGRQDFDDFSEEYYRELYDLFAPRQQARLFISEHQGEPLSALLVVAFRDTALYKRGGWLGRRSDLHPNEIMHWSAMCWAKSQGYRYYDFEGIEEHAAQAILGQQPMDTNSCDPLSKFKLSFGGEVRVNPRTFIFIRNPIFRFVHDRLYAPLSDRQLTKSLVTRVKLLRR